MFKPKFSKCKNKAKEYIVASSGCANDDAAVAALPDQWVPRHGGATLANYLNERELNHDKTLQDIASGAKAINFAINGKIRVLSENLLGHIQQTSKDMECLVQDKDMGRLTLRNGVREALKKIYQLNSDSIDGMARYKREATTFERERADSLRTLLRDHFQELIKIGHRTPKHLLYEYDERAYDVNQQFLSNCRAIIEMEAQLRIQAEENVVRTRSAINQLSLGVGISQRGRSALPAQGKIPKKNQEKSLKRRSLSAIGDDRRVLSDQPSISNILENVEKLEEFVSPLVQAYKAAVLRVFTDFSGKLTDLEKDLGSHPLLTGDKQSINHLALFQETLAKTTNSLYCIINKLSTRDMIEVKGNHLITIQKSLEALGQSLQDTYNILHDAGHLWDNHILRQAHAQRLTIAGVEDLITSNDSTELANEVTFNISLEQLRRSPSIQNLKSNYNDVVKLLESTGDMYRIHSETELGRLEEFMNLPTPLAKILLSEIDCFLEKYPRSKNFSEISEDTKESNVRIRGPTITGASGANAITCHFPRAILQTELQQVALSNWRNGFLESFASNYMLVPEELHRQARTWVEERSSPLQMRYSLKLVSHSIRAERAKAAQATRLAELQNHEIRLAEHLQAIQECIRILPLEIAEFGSIDSSFLYPLTQWMKRMKVDVDALLLQDPLEPELKRLKMKSYALRLVRHRQIFEESLNAAFESYKLQLEYRIQNVRVSNVRFMSLIKITHEGGRYSANEATNICISLVTAANALESSMSHISEAVNSRKKIISDEADQLMSRLSAIVGEVKTGKGTTTLKTGK